MTKVMDTIGRCKRSNFLTMLFNFYLIFLRRMIFFTNNIDLIICPKHSTINDSPNSGTNFMKSITCTAIRRSLIHLICRFKRIGRSLLTRLAFSLPNIIASFYCYSQVGNFVLELFPFGSTQTAKYLFPQHGQRLILLG